MADLDRCYWYMDDDLGKLHIPGCAGAAVYGPSGCTCVRDDSMRERLAASYRRLQRSERYADWARDQLIAAGLPFAPPVGEIRYD